MRRLQGEADCSIDFHTGRLCWCCRDIELLHRYPRCLRDCRNYHESSAPSLRFCISSAPDPELHNSHHCEPKSHSSHIGLESLYPHPRGARLCYRRGSHPPTYRESLAVVGALSPPRVGGRHPYRQTTWSPAAAAAVVVVSAVALLVAADISRGVWTPVRTRGAPFGMPSFPSSLDYCFCAFR